MMSVVLRVDKSEDLGEKLLSRLRGGEPQSDTIQFICGDSTTREAHTAVLAVRSPYFAKVLKDVPPGQTVEVDFFGEVMDLIFEHIYTGKPLIVRVEQTVELYAAATKFHLYDLKEDIRKFLLQSMDKCLETESFLKHDKVDDVYQLTDIFNHPELKCDRISLIQRITQWALRTSIEDIRPIVDTISKPDQPSRRAVRNFRRILSPVAVFAHVLRRLIQWSGRNWISVSIVSFIAILLRDERICLRMMN
ncbi:uncharacterized protein LOC108864298 [Galendromus occidentalis]|uniref:Uncharacterized protein LOC108864298 n=1 Tax=Galendromus occidentalis TaxID=34638 RepID=A0AAJ7L476_9ACAR|nr:uncharacterized protein LOC108864298 [Galendromus occidentalis]